ncbi:meiosis-specific nuclear structural protein 1 isoform X2 [Corythoichthys intestinalis]|uniref:meiosis-specific nuclear structural protein 1 isoform X2 n=1 Tax=Corythoichthys intestinalis TaxID=161448 RepID=UPI0025A66610|nr:meiosis-specific nuclear structural protein 1 isoform X2 [Corythoichthys intestinalis]
MNRQLTRNQRHRMLEQRRAIEEQRHQESARMDRDRKILAIVRDEDNVDKKRFLRQVQEEQKEREIENAMVQAQQEKMLKNKELVQEEKLARELSRINHERQREGKMRQFVRENSLELRELESKLKLAYVSKEQVAQMAEHEAIKCDIMRQETELYNQMKSRFDEATMEEERQEQRKQEEQLQYIQQLNQQLIEREHKRQVAYDDFLKEKLMVDEIVRKIYEEDQMERQKKLERVRATQKHIVDFKTQRAEWQRLEKERMEEENRRLREFVGRQKSMKADWMAKARAREDAIQSIRNTLAQKMAEENKHRDDMDRIRQALCLEEQEEAFRKKDIEEMEKNIRQRLMLQKTCEEQMAMKEMRRRAEKDEEAAFRKMTMEKFAEDDRLEQLSAQKRRMKIMEHKREAEKQIDDRRRQHQADKDMKAKEEAVEQERQAVCRQIIEEERLKLLQRHAVQLLGHLPKGLLREDDLKHFDEEFRKNFKTCQAENSETKAETTD